MNNIIQAIWQQFWHNDQNSNENIIQRLIHRIRATWFILFHELHYIADTGQYELAVINFVPRYESSAFHQCGDWDCVCYTQGKVWLYNTGCC